MTQKEGSKYAQASINFYFISETSQSKKLTELVIDPVLDYDN